MSGVKRGEGGTGETDRQTKDKERERGGWMRGGEKGGGGDWIDR